MATSDIKKGPLYVDSTNNRVGIGTSSPSQELEVAGTIRSSLSAADYSFGATTSGGGGFFIEPDDYTAANPTWEIRTFANEPLAFQMGGSERMRIDESGRVTMPSQPVFFAYNLNFPGSNAAGTASGGSVLVNVGSHYATGTGRFTAPIAGTYVFYMMTQSYDSGNTTGQYQTAVFRKNGSTVGAEAYQGWQPNDGNNHVQVQNTVIITLAANDYMMAYVQYGSRDIQNYFGGYLLG